MPKNIMNVTTKGDREIIITRAFDAPRQLVWDAHTKPELVRRWLLGPEGWTMPVCEIDLRVGGKYRYVWRHPQKGDMGMGGVFREVAQPERLVATEKFDESWYPGEAIDTSEFTESGGKTTLTLIVAYQSKEAREMALKSGMEKGMEVGYARLDDIFAEQLGAKS